MSDCSSKKNRLQQGDSPKRVCIVTGTHGDELEGQYVCFRLNQIIRAQLERLNGTVEIYPALNPLGIDSITRGLFRGSANQTTEISVIVTERKP